MTFKAAVRLESAVIAVLLAGFSFGAKAGGNDAAKAQDLRLFRGNVSPNRNIRTLKRACGDDMWSFLPVNRKTLKTSCFGMEKKNK